MYEIDVRFLDLCDKTSANEDSDSMYRRCPSAYTVSNASDDLPDPDTPVTTTSWSLGSSTEIFLRL